MSLKALHVNKNHAQFQEVHNCSWLGQTTIVQATACQLCPGANHSREGAGLTCLKGRAVQKAARQQKNYLQETNQDTAATLKNKYKKNKHAPPPAGVQSSHWDFDCTGI